MLADMDKASRADWFNIILCTLPDIVMLLPASLMTTVFDFLLLPCIVLFLYWRSFLPCWQFSPQREISHRHVFLGFSLAVSLLCHWLRCHGDVIHWLCWLPFGLSLDFPSSCLWMDSHISLCLVCRPYTVRRLYAWSACLFFVVQRLSFAVFALSFAARTEFGSMHSYTL